MNVELTYVYRSRVAFHETDGAEIVHFSNYLRYAEVAEIHALQACGLLPCLRKEKMVLPRVKVEAEYKASLKFWDIYEVSARITHIGQSSIHWQFDIMGEDAPVAHIKWITVRLNEAREKAPYTPEEKEQLNRLMQ